MNCLKCGKETVDPHVFCDACQADMVSVPVKPGTPIHLPHRPEPQEKKLRRRKPTSAETIASLKSMVRWLTFTVAVLTATICLLTWFLFQSMENDPATGTIGKNYTANTNISTEP